MSTATQFNPNLDLNAQLLRAGASKTVYALVTPETEAVKRRVMSDPAHMDMFTEAWTGKQDAAHEDFFTAWHDWSSPVVDLSRDTFPFYYPTAGASEAIQHLIYDLAARSRTNARVHVFEGEYEGYKAIAEAAGLDVIEHSRDWHTPFGGRLNRVAVQMHGWDLFFISQPSAIDGNVWDDFNEFVSKMPVESVVADVTYVGAVPEHALTERFNLNDPAIRNVVLSLSKPFGVYYDRVGGIWARNEDDGLFGKKWFKNLTSLKIGTEMMANHDVFDFPTRYAREQAVVLDHVRNNLGLDLNASDVFILGNGGSQQDDAVANYIRRAGRLRLCLSPGMYALIKGGQHG